MRIKILMRAAGVLWLAAVLSGLAQSADVPCVVCGEETRGGQAVIRGDQAYAIHEYGCLPIWQRAEEKGLLGDPAQRVAPGDPLFDDPELIALGPTERVTRGSVRVWAAFLISACLMSGSLAGLFAVLTHRPIVRAFLLGFCLPAIGMVLVPALPDLRNRAEPPTPAGEPGS